MKANECKILLAVVDGEVSGYKHVSIVEERICECDDVNGIVEDFFIDAVDEERHAFLVEFEQERVHPAIDYDEYSHYLTTSDSYGLHADERIIIETDVMNPTYVLPCDAEDYLKEVIFPQGLDWCPALDICYPGEDGEGKDIESMYFTHDKDGAIIELDTVDEFIWYIDDWKERVMEALKTSEPNDALFVEED